MMIGKLVAELSVVSGNSGPVSSGPHCIVIRKALGKFIVDVLMMSTENNVGHHMISLLLGMG